MTTPILEPLCAQKTIDTLGEVVIDGISMHVDGAWNCTDPMQLLMWTDTKGSNKPIARAHGDRAYPWYIAAGEYSLPFLIEGIYDVGLGQYASNPWVGLQHNIEYFRENVCRPPAAPTATVPVGYTLPDGNTMAAGGQPRLFEYTPNETETWPAVLTLIIPKGLLVPGGEIPTCGGGGGTNDMVDTATEFSLLDLIGTDTTDSTNYTRERDEPDWSGNASDDGFWTSAWWTFSGVDGSLDIDTIGSDFDTLLAVYSLPDPVTDIVFADMFEEATDDDSGGSGTSLISGLTIFAGYTYYVQVAGYSGVGGNIALNWTFTP